MMVWGSKERWPAPGPRLLLVGRIGTDLYQHHLEKAVQLVEGSRLLFGDSGVELMGVRLAQRLLVLEVPVDGVTRSRYLRKLSRPTSSWRSSAMSKA